MQHYFLFFFRVATSAWYCSFIFQWFLSWATKCRWVSTTSLLEGFFFSPFFSWTTQLMTLKVHTSDKTRKQNKTDRTLFEYQKRKRKWTKLYVAQWSEPKNRNKTKQKRRKNVTLGFVIFGMLVLSSWLGSRFLFHELLSIIIPWMVMPVLHTCYKDFDAVKILQRLCHISSHSSMAMVYTIHSRQLPQRRADVNRMLIILTHIIMRLFFFFVWVWFNNTNTSISTSIEYIALLKFLSWKKNAFHVQ